MALWNLVCKIKSVKCVFSAVLIAKIDKLVGSTKNNCGRFDDDHFCSVLTMLIHWVKTWIP